jgi:hypothetical protein
MYMLIGYIKIFSKAGHPSLAAAKDPASNAHSASVSNVVPVAGGRNPPVTVGSGIGRGIRRVFGEYFYSRTGVEIANLMTKYQNREGWNIKDVLTLIHIDPKRMKDDGGRLAIEHVFKTKEEFAPILAAAPPTAEPTKTLLSAIKEIHTIAERPLQPATNPSLAGLSNYQYGEELSRIVHLINTVGLCREQLPSQLFKYRKVWEALLFSKGANGKGKGMPLTALIRNLGKLTTAEIGIIAPFSTIALQSLTPTVKHICDRITDAADIKRTRIHPYTILVAMMTYKKGHGDKGGLTWSHNIHIVEALDKAFKLAFQNITPTGKRIKIALDVSGSMSSNFCTGSPVVSCAIGSVAMMMMTLYVENQHRGVAPPNGASSARLAAPGASPPPAIDCATTVPESVAGGRNPLWKTTQLPDGRTLYENTKTNECQFHKPQELSVAPSRGGGTPGATPSPSPSRPSLAEYKATKKYIGISDAQDSDTTARPPAPHFGYSSSYYTPPPPYLPELYPASAIPSNVTICAFSNTLTELTNSIVGYMDATIDPATGLPTMTIEDAIKLVEMPFSATDCSLPIVRALENKEQVDAFIIYTDSETYMGKIHPQAALEQYRAATGIDAKLIVVGMTSNCLTIADPKDLNTLNLAGFDTATPRLINDFIGGGFCPPTTGATEAHGDTDEFVMLNAED